MTQEDSPKASVGRTTGTDGPTPAKNPVVVQWGRVKTLVRTLIDRDDPWLGWAFVFAFTLFVFFVYRCIALSALITMYANAEDGTPTVVLGVLTLGFLEDFVCVTYFACTLWLVDKFKPIISKALASHHDNMVVQVAGNVAAFSVSWLLFVAVMIPVVADGIIVRLRDMRFTFDIVVMAIQEKDNASAFEVSTEEITDACVNATMLVLAASLFAVVRTRCSWADLARWNPTMIPLSLGPSFTYDTLKQTGSTKTQRTLSKTREDVQDPSPVTVETESDQAKELSSSTKSKTATTDENSGISKYVTVDIDDATESSEIETASSSDSEDDTTQCLPEKEQDAKKSDKRQYIKKLLIALVGLVLIPMVVIAVSCACSPLVAYSALNTTINEMFGHAFQPNVDGSTSILDDSNLPWVETYIHRKTENHELFGNDTLYRRTTGFKGDLAFDVKVNDKNPPNVLLLVIESFRFHDSHYLVGDEDPSNLFKGSNMTITPNFDKWAKRGVALRNYWSSWRTSRSVESLLFAQLPYDHVTKSGMTGGQHETNLSGLPQLFTAKGYETFFTTGCRTNYDSWDSFLPAHGFDTVWSRNELMKLAESDLGIKPGDWKGPEHRGLNWGVHDDLSFQLLGDLFVNKTKAQADRVARGEAKKPLFLTHYTISSHVNYKQRPKWYDESKKPDFSALYQGQKYADNIKNYLEIRYFTDMEFGKFMDRMAATGILNDTIVVISGDHGQGPEFGNDVPEDRDVSATRVAGAIVAEDITGVPEGGFEQDGVGRSLKRKIKFGERIVYSNNPTRKMSVVRGHERLRYDKVTESMLLHNADTDHDMQNDLLPTLTEDQRADWVNWRDAGRRINSYYTKRWEGQCLLASEC
ncbi:Sulfatase [Phytophthora megakarya]|uniref:Sulfatase n=1 Tax=Phytophthora megakarya TaxID=4795 RepID=A0A225WK58_9STRA|nr:Sulfatase [Phytophthora megakarya]